MTPVVFSVRDLVGKFFLEQRVSFFQIVRRGSMFLEQNMSKPDFLMRRVDFPAKLLHALFEVSLVCHKFAPYRRLTVMFDPGCHP